MILRFYACPPCFLAGFYDFFTLSMFTKLQKYKKALTAKDAKFSQRSQRIKIIQNREPKVRHNYLFVALCELLFLFCAAPKGQAAGGQLIWCLGDFVAAFALEQTWQSIIDPKIET